MKIGVFAGSFDPFTVGHKTIVDRSLELFDKVVVAFGINRAKKEYMPLNERMERVRKAYSDNPKVDVVSYEGLTVDLMKEIGAHYLIRGVRNSIDFEYERNIADINRKLLGIETVLLISDGNVSHISSSLVRELASFDKDVTDMII
ncbi:MAG: pantetheine-phosphate adenylyltransferase [bacterium]|nr:pantetheine-phosphate adenylyltransferase [Candidatus Minthenecus merdequi]